jgi:hypothetical protein
METTTTNSTRSNQSDDAAEQRQAELTEEQRDNGGYALATPSGNMICEVGPVNRLEDRSNQSDVAAAQRQTEQKGTNCYFIEYPRNFGNEYTVYVAATPATVSWCEDRVEKALDDCDATFARITRDHAIHRGIRAARSNEREASFGHSEVFAGGLFFDHSGSGVPQGSDREVLQASADALSKYVAEEHEDDQADDNDVETCWDLHVEKPSADITDRERVEAAFAELRATGIRGGIEASGCIQAEPSPSVWLANSSDWERPVYDEEGYYVTAELQQDSNFNELTFDRVYRDGLWEFGEGKHELRPHAALYVYPQCDYEDDGRTDEMKSLLKVTSKVFARHGLTVTWDGDALNIFQLDKPVDASGSDQGELV